MKGLAVGVLRVDYDPWGQTRTDLREMALSASHARSRERFLALYDMAQGACATQVAMCTSRHLQTVMGWLHTYNEYGPEALTYRRSGAAPLARTSLAHSTSRSVPHSVRRPGQRLPAPR